MTTIRALLHALYLCPRRRAKHPCSGLPGRCGWDWSSK